MSVIRTGRVSSIDYESGTYEVTYADRGESVTRRVNAMSNGEYRMPEIGEIVNVFHNSNGTTAATTAGTVWNQTNRPAEGREGLFRKELGRKPGEAYERYDSQTGSYLQTAPGQMLRSCGGDIRDVAGQSILLQAEEELCLETAGDRKDETGGSRESVTKGSTKETYYGAVIREYAGMVTEKISGALTISVNGATITIDNGGNVSISTGGSVSISGSQIVLNGKTTVVV